jgi:hypothetical protein
MVLKGDVEKAQQDKIDRKDKDGEYKGGMNYDRSGCSDIICCVIFLAFIASLVGITGYSVKNGDPMAMITPFDSNGNRCGMPNQGIANKTDFTDYPYKFMWSLRSLTEGAAGLTDGFRAECVKACPAKDTTPECIKNDGSTTGCEKAFLYGTTLVRTYCLPNKEAGAEILKVLRNAMESNSVMVSSVNDIQTTWRVIAGMAAATIVIALIYITLLRWFVKPLLYVSMILILVCFVLFGTWSFMKRSEFDATTQKKNYDYATAGAGIGFGLAFLYACFMCCCWKNISLGASIMEAASAFVTSNIRIVFLPIVAYVISIAFFTYWAITAVYMYGIGTVKYQAGVPFAVVENSKHTTYLAWYFLFGLLWVVAFFICLQQFIIASMTCMWYFK